MSTYNTNCLQQLVGCTLAILLHRSISQSGYGVDRCGVAEIHNTAFCAIDLGVDRHERIGVVSRSEGFHSTIIGRQGLDAIGSPDCRPCV